MNLFYAKEVFKLKKKVQLVCKCDKIVNVIFECLRSGTHFPYQRRKARSTHPATPLPRPQQTSLIDPRTPSPEASKVTGVYGAKFSNGFLHGPSFP